ncbi:1,4-dihydroxy-2-naphthoyl-CoA synthase [Streptomyces griseoloalbus]
MAVTDRKGQQRVSVDDSGADAQGDGEDPLALRLEQLILGAERRYTPFQAARSAGVTMELATRFWRAMGFADVGQAKALTEADVLALRRLAGLVEAGLLSEAMAVQVARSTGQTTARLAEWQIDSFLEGLTGAARARRVGAARAAELIFTARRVEAPEAREIGLVDVLVDEGRDREEALAMAARIAGNSPVGLRAAKRALRLGHGLDLPAGLEVEDAAWRSVAFSGDRAEGVAAFNEKRRPEWPGE